MNDTTEQRRNLAQRVGQRLFGELFRDCFNNNQLHEPITTPGAIITCPPRLVVVSAVAITLEVALLIILGSFSALSMLIRLIRRPLGLQADLSSTMSIAKLLSDGTDITSSSLHTPTRNMSKTNVASFNNLYGMEQGKLCLIDRESLNNAAGRHDDPKCTQAYKAPADLQGKKNPQCSVFGP